MNMRNHTQGAVSTRETEGSKYFKHPQSTKPTRTENNFSIYSSPPIVRGQLGAQSTPMFQKKNRSHTPKAPTYPPARKKIFTKGSKHDHQHDNTYLHISTTRGHTENLMMIQEGDFHWYHKEKWISETTFIELTQIT